MAVIKLEARVSQPPVFDGVFRIPVDIDKVIITENGAQIIKKDGIDVVERVRRTPSITYRYQLNHSTALPIFEGDRIRVYMGEIGIFSIQERSAERIELLNEEGNVRAIYKVRED